MVVAVSTQQQEELSGADAGGAVILVVGSSGPVNGHATALDPQPAASASEPPPASSPSSAAPSGWLYTCAADFAGKLKGTGEKPLAPEPWRNLLVSWVGALLSMVVLTSLQQYASPEISFDFLIASFGASAVLVFGVPGSKLSQPRNVIGGHTFSALTGAIVRVIIRPKYEPDFVSGSLGMSLAMLVMQVTGTTHPPAGATALIAALASPIPTWEGFQFVLTAAAGSAIMVVVACIYNNVVPNRRYPTFW